MFSHRERLERCLTSNQLDRTPVALWRHFPVDDQTAEGLAAATINFQNNFDFDLVKVTPESSFCLKDWGSEDRWEGAIEGTRTYTRRVISQPEDWKKLPVLDPNHGYLRKQIECLKLITKESGSKTPVIQTIFNPLSQAKNLVGNDKLLIHLRKYPDALKEGLDKIAQSTQNFIDLAKKTGISGIFYAVQHAQYSLLDEQEYTEFGTYFDKVILDLTQDLWLNMLHLHGCDIMFERFIDYPFQIINWHDQETEPNLRKGKSIFPGVVCGGLRRFETIVLGTQEKINKEVQEAIRETEQNRFILGTGCVTPITAPYGNILAARKSVEIV